MASPLPLFSPSPQVKGVRVQGSGAKMGHVTKSGLLGHKRPASFHSAKAGEGKCCVKRQMSIQGQASEEVRLSI